MQKKSRGIVRFLAVLMAFAVTFSYAPNVMAAGSQGSKVKSVTVTNLPGKTLTLKVGKTANLKVKVTGTGKVSQKVTYKSNKAKVATVSSKGKVTAKKKGTAKITIASKADKRKKAVITVTVGLPVTKVSLNQTSLTIVQGKTAALKATVAPAKASNKKVVWKSSNTKVATVSSKGIVKGIKAGTAKITATAADGSGKKRTATVVVKNPVTVNSVSVVNASTIQVNLSEAQAGLNVSNFAVKVNSSGKGSYNKVCKLDNIVTTDNKTYLVVLDSGNCINNQENVQVTVTGLFGSASSVKTTTYSEGVFKYTGTKMYKVSYNEKVNQSFTLSGYGYSACTVTGLPSGMKYESDGKEVHFYGKPRQKGKVVSVLASTDELGNTYTYSITWLISSSDTISAVAAPCYLKLVSGSATVDVDVEVSGGSGSYIYSLAGNTYGLQIGSSTGTISGKLLAAGTYTLTVNVQDANNPAYKTTASVVINVASTISVSGIVKDASGNPIPNAKVYYTNKDKATRYGAKGSASANSNGSFSMTLVAGTYDIEAEIYSSHRYLYSQALTTTRSGFDITLPVQRVVLYSSNASVDASSLGYWYDEAGNTYGNGNTLWLKPGRSYALSTETKMIARKNVSATVNLTVTAATASATASVTAVPILPVGSITAEQPVTLSVAGTYKYYTFTPTTTGTYYFYSESSIDTYGCLEDANAQVLKTNDDSGQGNNFYYVYNCTAGVTYYIGIRKYGGGTGTATLYVSATQPAFAASTYSLAPLGNSDEDSTGSEEALSEEESAGSGEILSEEESAGSGEALPEENSVNSEKILSEEITETVDETTDAAKEEDGTETMEEEPETEENGIK